MMTTLTEHLTTLTALSFRGGDAAHFLQGQLTIDTQQLAAGRWRRAAYCSRQGRIIAAGILARLADEHFMFIVSADLAPDTAAMLQRFVLRAKVSIEQPAATIVAAGADIAAPALADGDLSNDNGIISIDEGEGRRLLVGIDATAQDVAGGDVASGTAWQRSEIQRGVPWISAATQDSMIPQFVNYELLGGVDFSKGCFVGQEVIARLHHLGEVKRRGMLISGGAAATVAPGDQLKTAADKPAGDIINAAPTADGADGFIAFAAVAKSAMAEALNLNGNTISLQPPPYPLIEQEKFKRK